MTTVCVICIYGSLSISVVTISKSVAIATGGEKKCSEASVGEKFLCGKLTSKPHTEMLHTYTHTHVRRQKIRSKNKWSPVPRVRKGESVLVKMFCMHVFGAG